VNKLIDFIIANWQTLTGAGGTVAGVSAWLSERKKRRRDNRDADVAFWEKTIEAQNAYIEKLELKIDQMSTRYELQIANLLKEVADLSDRLEQYEPKGRKIRQLISNPK
jgi:predicted RNase H-like nuclease (RuvC/YqgF family)